MNGRLKSHDPFTKLIEVLINRACTVYTRTRVVGLLIIAGCVLGIVLTFLATAPYPRLEPYEFIPLVILAALLILSGTLLYAFVANLEYKYFEATSRGDLKALEQYSKKSLLDKTAGEL